MAKRPSTFYFAEKALLSGTNKEDGTLGWASNVLLEVQDGKFHSIQTNCLKQNVAYKQAIKLSGPVLPTLPNVHSHAFQRIMAGMAEVSLNPNDSFWSWRELMYKVVQKLTPDDTRIIATQLYIDMLKAGYTQVGEFHYLHHNQTGQPYNNIAEMSHQLIEAANNSGIGLTLLPALYSYSGFGGQTPNAGQSRFINSTDRYLNLQKACEQELKNHHYRHKLGICFHSLRAVTKTQIEEVLQSLDIQQKVHIHIAEQQKEIQDCLHWSKQRPVEWLYNQIGLDSRWCLVHATHLDESELQSIAKSKAVVGLCPTTEANLGDGIFPAVDFEKANGYWGIGSDSHVSLSIVEELRTLEYGQRLRDQQRNRLYRPTQNSIGNNLFQQALIGGNQACDVSLGLKVGHRADFMVLDHSHPFIMASPPKDIMNRWLFACNDNLVRDVFVAGKHVINNFFHEQEQQSRLAFTQTIKKVIYDV